MGNMFADTEWYRQQMETWSWLEAVPKRVQKWYVDKNRTIGEKCADCRFFVVKGSITRCGKSRIEDTWNPKWLACGDFERESK
jgi:hypothetical protein